MSKLIWGIIVLVLIVLGVSMLKGDGVEKSLEDISGDDQSEVVSIKTAVGVEVAALVAVDGSDSFGSAYGVRTEDSLILLVEATMPDPGEGNVYEGWLVDNSVVPLQFFSTGVMERDSSGTWVLEYEVDQEYPDHNLVVITEETIVDATPEEHIIEGSFE